MSESIYAPPEADLTAPANGTPRYYVVAPIKFALLSVLTFTLYFVYWFYRNWKLIKIEDNNDIWPVPRSFFFIFFTHSLFRDVQASLNAQQRQFDWRPELLATLFVLFTIVGNISDRLIPFEAYPLLSSLAPLASTLVTTFLLLPAQRAINAACGEDGSSNSRLTMANWLWMILGGALWLLILVGTYAMIVDPTLQ